MVSRKNLIFSQLIPVTEDFGKAAKQRSIFRNKFALQEDTVKLKTLIFTKYGILGNQLFESIFGTRPKSRKSWKLSFSLFGDWNQLENRFVFFGEIQISFMGSANFRDFRFFGPCPRNRGNLCVQRPLRKEMQNFALQLFRSCGPISFTEQNQRILATFSAQRL